MFKLIICLGFTLFVGWLLSLHFTSVHSLVPVEALASRGVTWLIVVCLCTLAFSWKIVHGKS
jgi:hypothetical protein